MAVEDILNRFLTRLGSQASGEEIAQLFCDDANFSIPGSPAIPWIGDRSSRREIANFFDELSKNIFMESFEIEQKTSVDDVGIVIGKFRSRFNHNRQIFESPFLLKIRVQKELIPEYLFLENSFAAAAAYAQSDQGPAYSGDH